MRVALTGGAYQARSLAAGAQACINLFPEKVPDEEGEPVPVAHYPTPGLLRVSQAVGEVRGIYFASNSTVYVAIGSVLYLRNNDGTLTVKAALLTSAGMVSMSDNGVSLMMVDGSVNGYVVDLASGVSSLITDPAFYGAVAVDIIDGFFVLDRPGTNQFYLSNNVDTTFDPLYIVAKNGLDLVVRCVVSQRELWILGQRTTEVWSNVGAADFPLQIMSGGIDAGCISARSVVRLDGSVFWLSRNQQGQGIVLRGASYQAKRISTHAIEAAIAGYVLTDAAAWSYQIDGHSIYVLTFPTSNATWCYDVATGSWHEMQSGGARHRGICAVATDKNVLVGDHTNGAVYFLDRDTWNDNGVPIMRRRAFPHISAGGDRMIYSRLIVDMQAGTTLTTEPLLTLDWSDDRGASWGNPVTCGMGAAGAGLTSLQFRRMGLARDRVFRLTWDAPVPTVLLGAWIEAQRAGT